MRTRVNVNLTGGDSVDIGLYKVRSGRDWLKNEATWRRYRHPYTSYPWGMPGCESAYSDRYGLSDATLTFDSSSPSGRHTWSSTELRHTVWDWHRGATTNRGWLLRVKDVTASSPSGVGFFDRESFSVNCPQLTVDYGIEPIYWTGDASEYWDTTSVNWEWETEEPPTYTADTTYFDGPNGDDVIFSGEVFNSSISIVGSVAPKSILVDTYANFSFSGDEITGSCDLTKLNDGTLWLEAANSYTGETNIEDGMVYVGTNNALGRADNSTMATKVFSGATLAFYANTDDINYSTPECLVVTGQGHEGMGVLQNIDGNNRFAGQVWLYQEDCSINCEHGTRLTLTGQVTYDERLIKDGGGTLELTSSDNDYTGGTLINDGTLLANNSSGSATGLGSVTVANGGTLGGEGFICTYVLVKNGGRLAPGNGIGSLALGCLDLIDGAHLLFELDTPDIVDPEVNDIVNVFGALTLNGVLDVTAQSGFGLGTYTLITCGSFTDYGLRLGDMPDGFNYEIDTSEPDKVKLLVLVPEPSSLVLLAASLLALAMLPAVQFARVFQTYIA